MSYGRQEKELKELKSRYEGRKYKHYKWGTLYTIDKVTRLQCSSFLKIDELPLVEYSNSDGETFHRLLREFQDTVILSDLRLVKRFVELNEDGSEK